MALESACIPVPSEVIMPFAGGLIATRHLFNIHLLALTGALGNLAGSAAAYVVGAWGGRPFIYKYGKYVLIRQRDIDSADKWFAKYGQATVFFSRMLPIIRTFISLPAGIARMPFGLFCIYTFVGALPWCYLLAWLGLKLGEHWDTLAVYFHKADLVVGIVLALLFALWLWHHFRPEHSEAESGQAKASAIAADPTSTE
jgi:membrane protein DedA with SNARE-associated domain